MSRACVLHVKGMTSLNKTDKKIKRLEVQILPGATQGGQQMGFHILDAGSP